MQPMRSRPAAVLSTIGLAAAISVTAVSPAAADTVCVVSSFSPRSVVVGLTPVVSTFDVRTTGCTESGWSITIGDFRSFTYDGNPEETFSPFSNAEAGPDHVTVEATNADYRSTTRVFPASSGFSLLRRTAWLGGSFNASPEPARRGSAISIKGRLMIANWDTDHYVGYGGRTVSVEFRTPSGTYSQIKTVKTAADGWLRTTVPARSTGVWRVRYAGNAIAGPAVVVGDAVSVT